MTKQAEYAGVADGLAGAGGLVGAAGADELAGAGELADAGANELAGADAGVAGSAGEPAGKSGGLADAGANEPAGERLNAAGAADGLAGASGLAGSNAAGAADELATLQRYLETCAGLRHTLGIEGSAPQLHRLAQGECNVNYWFAAPQAALDQLEARGGVRSDRLVLRVNHVSQIHLEKQIAYEFSALDLLEPCGRTPRTLWYDASRAHLPWGVGVEEFLPGRPLSYQTDMPEAACILADIHAVEVTGEGRRGLICPANPLLGIAQECRQMFEKYRAWRAAEDFVVERVEAMMRRAFTIAQNAGNPAGRRLCIANTELNSHNFLIGDNGRPSYLIDWEKPLLSVPEQDLSHFLVPTTTNWKTSTILNRAQREAFLDEYEQAVAGRFPTQGLRERLDAYLTVTCLRGITWCAMACVDYTEGGPGLRNEDAFDKIKQFLSREYLEMIWDDFYRTV